MRVRFLCPCTDHPARRKKLDTNAEMVELRRTQQGELNEEDADILQDIVDAYHFYHDGKKKRAKKSSLSD